MIRIGSTYFCPYLVVLISDLLKTGLNDKLLGVFNTFQRPCKSKVAKLDSTIFIDKDVSRFNISVEDVCRVNVLEGT